MKGSSHCVPMISIEPKFQDSIKLRELLQFLSASPLYRRIAIVCSQISTLHIVEEYKPSYVALAYKSGMASWDSAAPLPQLLSRSHRNTQQIHMPSLQQFLGQSSNGVETANAGGSASGNEFTEQQHSTASSHYRSISPMQIHRTSGSHQQHDTDLIVTWIVDSREELLAAWSNKLGLTLHGVISNYPTEMLDNLRTLYFQRCGH
jgi:hypothetical protein